MRTLVFLGRGIAVLLLGAGLAGCGSRDEHEAGHSHESAHSHDHDHDHDHGGEADAGVSFQAGKGVWLDESVRTNLDLAVAEAEMRDVPIRIGMTVQVFGEEHHHGLDVHDHAGCDVHGSGFLAPETAGAVVVGQRVTVDGGGETALGGVVLAVQRALALGESEIVVGVSNATARLRGGQFIRAQIAVPRVGPVLAIPSTALLRTAEGTFVYGVRGEAYLRIPVRVGAEGDGWVEVVEGLRAGEKVVIRPPQTLWLIELRATRGGGHSH